MSADTNAKDTRPLKARGGGLGGLFAGGGVVAALGASACCVVPTALFALGASGPWIGGLGALSPYQPYFLGASILAVAAGAYEMRRRTKLECADETCARPRSSWIAKSALAISVVLVALNLAWERIVPVLFGS